MVTATNVLDMLDKNWETINEHFDHIPAFTLDEIQDFLDGKAGADVKGYSNYTRSAQVKQAVSAIGASKVDDKKADADTVVVYKALWAIEKACKCGYCKKPFSYSLMFGNRGNVCTKSRCQTQYMRDSM